MKASGILVAVLMTMAGAASAADFTDLAVNASDLEISAMVKGNTAPVPVGPTGSPCAALPVTLAIANSSAYDAQTITCLSGLVAIPDYVSPLAAVPAPTQLSKDESAAVDKYVDSYAYLVNAALRKGEGVSKYLKFIDTLNSALRKMPLYRGVTFRGSAFPPLPADKLVAGAVFTDPAFLSTSRNLAVAEGYTGAAGYLSVILSKTGRQISYNSSISELDTEIEVLFPTDTHLRVIAISPRTDGVTIVYLEELPKN